MNARHRAIKASRNGTWAVPLEDGRRKSKSTAPSSSASRVACRNRSISPEKRYTSVAVGQNSTGVPNARLGNAQCSRDVTTMLALA